MRVDYILQRMDERSDSSYGILFDSDMLHKCFIIEDESREVKVKGETRIPQGEYKIVHRKELSPLTEKYREKYAWFDWHLMIEDVPDFEWCYIHVGNFESNTDGCLLTNKNISEVNGQWVGGNSVNAFSELYKEMSYYLDQGYEVYITIRDEDYLKQPF